MGEVFHFQVNLGGMIDILSNHLYKSPDVFLRELLQNGVDAIAMRKKGQPGWDEGRLEISLEPGRRMVFRDNGAGLTEEGIHQFLAVIGQSSKTQLVDGRIPTDYIGRFGIGLLSCFMVADKITIHTRPAGGGPAHIWEGMPDGTYTLRPLDPPCAAGTQVHLTAKIGCEQYFQPETVRRLVKFYGLALPCPVYLAGEEKRLNRVPESFSNTSRSQLLDFGHWLFGKDFLDAIPIHTPQLNGVAYILPAAAPTNASLKHRIYLKNMLLTEDGQKLLPPWAFFLQCFLNTNTLQPTASRENFYENAALDQARQEFSDAVAGWMRALAQRDPAQLRLIVATHSLAIKSMAVWDGQMLRMFSDFMQFETSEGAMTGRRLKEYGPAVWVSSVDKFRQLRSIFLAQRRLLICAGYVYDQELIPRMAKMFSLPLAPLSEEKMETVLEELALDESQQAHSLLLAANRALAEFDCTAEVRRFEPEELPTLYTVSEEVQFLRQIQSAREASTGIFSEVMDSFLDDMADRPTARLYFNFNCPLVKRLCAIRDSGRLESVARILYVQALMVGGYPLRGSELQVMSQEILYLIGWGDEE